MRIFVLLLTLLLPGAALTALSVGETIPQIPLEDQHGERHELSREVRLILFAPDRAASKTVEAALAGRDAAFLEQLGAVYVADISGMPAVITRMFALPKLRERAYPVLLGKESADTEPLPRRSASVTLLGVEDGKIKTIRFITKAHELRGALQP